MSLLFNSRLSTNAFTLIELLIVVAIIAILAAIAVPNFLEAQIRAKVTRIKADQRTIATAIESYAVDNNKYPIRNASWATNQPAYAPNFNEKIYAPSSPTAAVGMHVLTTPVSYIGSLPQDLFATGQRAMMQPGNPYSDAIDYWDPKQADDFVMNLQSRFNAGVAKGWMLLSVGPDKVLGVLASGSPGGWPGESFVTQGSRRFFYDPTNGTISVGNIYRFAGELSQRSLTFGGG